MLRILALVIALAATAVAQQDTASANADSPSASSKTADSRKIAAIEELLSLTKVDQTLQRILLQFEAAFSQQVEKLVPPLQDRELRSKILQDVQEFQTQIFDSLGDGFVLKISDPLSSRSTMRCSPPKK
jgi:hypothetical protein